VPIERDVRIREVVEDEQLPLAGEVDDPHEVQVNDDGRRVVREREHEHAGRWPRPLPGYAGGCVAHGFPEPRAQVRFLPGALPAWPA
jgi:hypothetical protein